MDIFVSKGSEFPDGGRRIISHGAEATAERLHARDVLLLATDGDDRHGRGRVDLPHDQRRNPVALFAGLSALGL